MILQVGFGLTGTVNWQLPGHPSLVIVSVSVKEPEAPAVTLTDAPSFAPFIVPSPLIVQMCVTVPPAGKTVEV